MKIFIQRTILLLLLALQGVAPLVHAHVQAESNKGVHFHGFSVQVNQQTEVASLDFFAHCDAVIDVKLAVVQKKTLDCELSNDSFTLSRIHFPSAIVITTAIASSVYIASTKQSIKLSTAIPRAPPL